MVVDQSLLTTHGPLQALQPATHEPLHAEVSFLAMVESEVENLPPPRVDS